MRGKVSPAGKRRQGGVSSKMRVGDQVMAIAGNDKGGVGTVMATLGEKILVRGLNVKKKHVKPNPQNPQGGTQRIEKPIHVSNLRVCNQQGIPVKLKVASTPEAERALVYIEEGVEKLHRVLKKRKG